jgi:hypothetical protein
MIQRSYTYALANCFSPKNLSNRLYWMRDCLRVLRRVIEEITKVPELHGQFNHRAVMPLI